MSVYGYIRINSRRPRPQKLSLLQQSRMIRDYADSKGWALKQNLRDIVTSDRSEQWTRLNRLKQFVESGRVSVLIVPRLDRLGRDIRKVAGLLELLKKHKVRLVALADGVDSNTRSGKAVLKTLEHVGCWENRRIPDLSYPSEIACGSGLDFRIGAHWWRAGSRFMAVPREDRDGSSDVDTRYTGA